MTGTNTDRTLVAIRHHTPGGLQIELDPSIRRLVLAGVVAAVIYGAIGLVIALGNDAIAEMSGLDKLFSIAGMVLFWPLNILGIDVALISD